MIKNKVNPVAAEGTSSCERAGGRMERGERGGKEGWRRRREEGLEEKPHSEEKTVFAHLWGRKG